MATIFDVSQPLSQIACARLSALGPAVILGGYRFRTLRWGADVAKRKVQPRHHHAFCEILLLHAGEIHSECDELLHVVQAPAVMVTLPGERHRHGLIGPVDWDWWALTIERCEDEPQDGLEDLVESWIARHQPAAELPGDVLSAVAVFQRELDQAAPGWRRAVAWTIQGLLLAVIRATARETLADSEEELDVESVLRRAVRAQPANPWSVADLAALAGVGQRQLARILRRCAGCTPLELVTTERVDLAEAMLLQDGATVAAVAVRLGYSDVHYFARLFKRYRGVSPAGWRAVAAAYRVEDRV